MNYFPVPGQFLPPMIPVPSPYSTSMNPFTVPPPIPMYNQFPPNNRFPPFVNPYCHPSNMYNFPTHPGSGTALGQPSCTPNSVESAVNFKRKSDYSSNSYHLKKKSLLEKRDLLEYNQYRCDVCDRGWKDEGPYKLHIAEHEECSIPGCTYKAAPKLVALHYQWQHRTGLASKIWLKNKESQAEIDKWKDERRRNYPTPSNIERKKKQLEAKIERGEVLGAGNLQHVNHSEKGRGRGGRRGRGSGKQLFPNSSVGSTFPTPPVYAASVDGGSVQDIDSEVKSEGNFPGGHKSVSSEKNQMKCNPLHPPWKSGGSFHPIYYRKPSLLRRILASELRHERNVILQCIRHIVRSSYFGLDKASSSTSVNGNEDKLINSICNTLDHVETSKIVENAA